MTKERKEKPHFLANAILPSHGWEQHLLGPERCGEWGGGVLVSATREWVVGTSSRTWVAWCSLAFRSGAGFGVQAPGLVASGVVGNGGAEPPRAAGRRLLRPQGCCREQRRGLGELWHLCWPQNPRGRPGGEARGAVSLPPGAPQSSHGDPLWTPLCVRPGGSWAERERCGERDGSRFLNLLFLVGFENCKAPSLRGAVSTPPCFPLHVWPRSRPRGAR